MMSLTEIKIQLVQSKIVSKRVFLAFWTLKEQFKFHSEKCILGPPNQRVPEEVYKFKNTLIENLNNIKKNSALLWIWADAVAPLSSQEEYDVLEMVSSWEETIELIICKINLIESARSKL